MNSALRIRLALAFSLRLLHATRTPCSTSAHIASQSIAQTVSNANAQSSPDPSALTYEQKMQAFRQAAQNMLRAFDEERRQRLESVTAALYKPCEQAKRDQIRQVMEEETVLFRAQFVDRVKETARL
ncbi:hypothetical protein IAR50_000783 [Cryptococcus sp. DSM 104548]